MYSTDYNMRYCHHIFCMLLATTTLTMMFSTTFVLGMRFLDIDEHDIK